MNQFARTHRFARIAALLAAAAVVVPPTAAANESTHETTSKTDAYSTSSPTNHARGTWTLGPKAYKSLKLGMPKRKALKTGLLRDPEKIGACTWYYLQPSEGAPNPGSGVVIHPRRGVVSIPGTQKMHTPQGIRMGSVGDHAGSRARAIKRRYDRYAVDTTPFPIYTAPTPGNRKAHYVFAMGNDHRVKDMALTLNKNGCGLSNWPY